MQKYVLLIVAVVSLALLGGCAADMAARKRVEQPLPARSRLAVLPFENLSGTESAGEKVTSYFHNGLITSDRVAVVEYGQVYDALRRYRIRSATQITTEQIEKLAADLDVAYLLAGSVLEFEERDDRFLGIIPLVSFNCRLIDCRTGATVWVLTSNGRGDKGEIVFGIGAVRSADNLARMMVEEASGKLESLFQER